MRVSRDPGSFLEVLGNRLSVKGRADVECGLGERRMFLKVRDVVRGWLGLPVYLCPCRLELQRILGFVFERRSFLRKEIHI